MHVRPAAVSNSRGVLCVVLVRANREKRICSSCSQEIRQEREIYRVFFLVMGALAC